MRLVAGAALQIQIIDVRPADDATPARVDQMHKAPPWETET